jgi:serine/threonine-protein kinase
MEDITKWSAADKKTILAIYNAGSKVPGIEKNSNWMKRVDDMDKLKNTGEGE